MRFWLLFLFTPALAFADPGDGDRNAPTDVGAEPMEKKTNVSATVNPDQAALTQIQTKAWSILATTVTSVGLGTFVKDYYASDPYVDQALYIEPAYVFKLPHDYKIRVSARESLDWELTKPDNPSNRFFNWSDILLGASTRLYAWQKPQIDFWAGLRTAIPISAQSQQAGLITSLVPSLAASRGFEWSVAGKYPMSLLVRYDFGVRKNFNRTNVPVYSTDPNTAVIPTIVMRSTDAYADGGLAYGNASVDFSFSNALLLSWAPHPLVTVSVFGGIINAFKYPIVMSRDAYTSPFASVGYGRQDEIRTNIDVTVNLPAHLFLSGGLFTVEPPFAPNNRSPYDPFFNSDSAASNYTTFYVSFAGQI